MSIVNMDHTYSYISYPRIISYHGVGEKKTVEKSRPSYKVTNLKVSASRVTTRTEEIAASLSFFLVVCVSVFIFLILDDPKGLGPGINIWEAVVLYT